MEINNKAIRGWVWFDWANSAYSLVIVSTIFPQIFSHELKDVQTYWGFQLKNSDTLYTLCISISYLFIVLVSPLLGGLSDYSNQKKKYMQFFTYLGGLACVLLYFFNAQNITVGLVGVILGSIGFSGSMVFYNAYLPEIVPQNLQNKISARGYAMGYIGSSILLIGLVFLSSYPSFLGLNNALEVFKLGFIIVGLWWVLWAQITFKYLPKTFTTNRFNLKLYFAKGWETIQTVRQKIAKNTAQKKFLYIFFCISLGIQTLWIIAPLFAIKVIKMEGSELIAIVLLMQFLGVVGAYLLSFIAQKFNNLLALKIACLLFIAICISGIWIQQKSSFYILATLMGSAMGGLQSISRSTFSMLIQEETQHASFFSFYDVLEKLAILMGTSVISIIYFTNFSFYAIPTERLVLLVLSVFFVSAIFLLFIHKKQILRK
jgi:UMF1 family MFS transporter